MSNNSINQEYKLVRIAEGKSSRYQTPLTTIWFKGLEDGLDYKTYISPDNFNAIKWDKIIDSKSGITVAGLKVKDQIRRLLNADSRPVITLGGTMFSSLFG